MKKWTTIASLVALVGVVCANMVASIAWFNQPKTPSMLSK